MNFLHPQLLFGLCALAIPIIIHLFNFRRTKRVYFSNTKFLKKVKEASSSKLKLKHYLILLSRLLAVFFLVVAFAQPYISSDSSKSASNQVIIYLDNSASMSNELPNGISAFDVSVGHVNKLVEIYPKGTAFKLITNEFDAFATIYKSASEIEEYLTTLKLTGQSRELQEISSRMNDAIASDSLDVYWLSDFQKATAGANEVQLDSLLNLSLVPLTFQSENNVYIDSLYLENPFMLGNEQVSLNVRVVNKGSEAVSQLGVKVFLDELQVATAILDLPALGKETISFNVGFDLKKENKGRVIIEEYPVTFDNELYFVINETDEIDILEIKTDQTENYVSNVFGNENLFDLKSYDAANVDYNLIEKSDLVIVNGLDNISSALITAIQERQRNSKAIMLIPGLEPDEASYKALFSQIGKTTSEQQIGLAAPDFDNPFFRNVFEARNVRFAMPKASPVLNLGIDRTALLKFQTGTPFLRQSGTLYMLAAPLKSGISTFQSHALFVPVMYRIASESANGMDRLYYYVDEGFFTTATDTLLSDDVYKLRNESIELIPAQKVSGGKVIMEIPSQNLQSGYYDLTLRDNVVSALAFNNSPNESNLLQIKPSEYSEYFKSDFEVINATDELAFEEIVKNKYQGEPLWKWSIILCLLFLLFEVLLIRFFP